MQENLSKRTARRPHVPDDVAESHTEVISDASVDADLLVGDSIVGEDNADSLAAPLALQQDGVTAKQLKLVHLALSTNGHCLFN